MKKKFIAQGQTRFNAPVISLLKNGTVRKYTKATKMPVGYKNVIRDDSAETEEGYRSVYEVWENKQGVLYRVIDSNESDCDGRHSSHTEQKLVDGNWLTVNQSQRDYRAESMGY